MTSSWFFLSTLNYEARSTTHQTNISIIVKLSSYRPGQASRLPESEVPRIHKQPAHQGATVVSTSRRPDLPPTFVKVYEIISTTFDAI